MFDTLSQRLQDVTRRLRGQGRLTPENMRDTLRDVRMALLEADVALPVVKNFIEHVRTRAEGQEVLDSLTPGQALVKIVHDELIAVMGEPAAIDVAMRPPAVILVAGLQGAGKTTTVAKLARLIQTRMKKSVLLASADVYRPAAIEQLRILASRTGVDFYEAGATSSPVDIATGALESARTPLHDVLLIDTAGRLHIDEAMMNEIRAIHSAVAPIETLFVVDSMTGQDAVNTAKAFDAALPLTGIVLTKTDGDARGGAALSVRQVTGKPIKFLGTGEGLDALEVFDAARLVSRLLGMGDIVGLVEKAHQVADRAKAEAVARKLAKGKGFDLEDFRDQLMQMEQMGGLTSLLEKLPGAGALPVGARAQLDDRQTRRLVAIINSMTPAERRRPDTIRGSRKRRIAAGSGTQVQDVNRLLKQFDQSQKMMKRFGKGGAQKMLQALRGKIPGMPG